MLKTYPLVKFEVIEKDFLINIICTCGLGQVTVMILSSLFWSNSRISCFYPPPHLGILSSPNLGYVNLDIFFLFTSSHVRSYSLHLIYSCSIFHYVSLCFIFLIQSLKDTQEPHFSAALLLNILHISYHTSLLCLPFTGGKLC